MQEPGVQKISILSKYHRALTEKQSERISKGLIRSHNWSVRHYGNTITLRQNNHAVSFPRKWNFFKMLKQIQSAERIKNV